jgi:hypothetical protein
MKTDELLAMVEEKLQQSIGQLTETERHAIALVILWRVRLEQQLAEREGRQIDTVQVIDKWINLSGRAAVDSDAPMQKEGMKELTDAIEMGYETEALPLTPENRELILQVRRVALEQLDYAKEQARKLQADRLRKK